MPDISTNTSFYINMLLRKVATFLQVELMLNI